MSSPRGAIVRAAMQSLCATKRCSSRIPSRWQNDTAGELVWKTHTAQATVQRDKQRWNLIIINYPKGIKEPCTYSFHLSLSLVKKEGLVVFVSWAREQHSQKEVANKLVSCCILCEGHVRHSFGAHFSLQKHQEEYHQHLSTASPLMHVLLSGESFDEDASIPSPNRRTVCRKLGGFWEMSKIKTSWVHWHRTDQLGWGVHGVRAVPSGFSELSHRTPPEVPISALSWRERASGVASIENILRLIHAKKRKKTRKWLKITSFQKVQIKCQAYHD